MASYRYTSGTGTVVFSVTLTTVYRVFVRHTAGKFNSSYGYCMLLLIWLIARPSMAADFSVRHTDAFGSAAVIKASRSAPSPSGADQELRENTL